jgi:hypothetical protein
MEFWEFCPKVLGLTLTPGQNVIAKVAFGDYDPVDLEGEEYDLAIQMFGGVERVPKSCRRYVLLRLGRGSGKTTLCAAYAVYCALTHDIRKCGPGDVAYVVTVAPDKETAKLSVRMCREMIRAVPAINRLVSNDTDTMIAIQRPDGRMVKIESFAATRGGSSMRGRTIIAFIFDEAEFFTSNADGGKDYSVNDEDIFKALKPRLLPNGKGMLISTPWPVETLMGRMFEENWGKPKSAVSIKAPTSLVRGNDPDVMAMVADELEKDPDNARRELFCEIDHVGGGDFFDVNAITTSMDKETLYEFPLPYNPRWPVAVGCDLGFTRDSSSIVVVQYDGVNYRTVYMDEIRPKPGQPLKPSHVMKKFAEVAKRYGSSSVVADGYYKEALREVLDENKMFVIDAPEGTTGKAKSYQRVRSVLHEGRCKIPDVPIGRRLKEQAKMVTSKPAPGGTVTIRVPRKLGMGHGDIVSAWVLAVNHLAYDDVRKEKPVYDPGTPEWLAESTRRIMTAEDKRQADYLKTIEREMKTSMGRRRLQELFKNR